MTVHPWPLNDTAPGARQAVVWRGGAARGLLIDTPAVPLCFADSLPFEDTPTITLQAKFDDAQERIRRLEALLVVRGIPMTA